MKNSGFVLSLTAALFSLVLVNTASAQPDGAVCNVSEGTAIIHSPGLNGSAPGNFPFAFSNDCGAGRTQGCAVGSLSSATCAENLHQGNFVYCPTGSCQLDCEPLAGIQACDANNVHNAVIVGTADCVQGTFSGACVGNLCVGSVTADVLYLLAFDSATSQAALSTCPPDPVGTGGSLTSASFTGVIVY